MKRFTLLATLLAVVVPAAAHADDVALRLGLETPIYTHYNRNGASGSYWVSDSFQPAVDLLLEYYPHGWVGFGAELREGFAATGQTCVSNTCVGYSRTGTALGPNLTLDLGPTPAYVRGALPIHLEPSPVRVDFRAAGGLKFALPVLSIYVEAAVDFPLAGSGVSAFDQQQVNLGAGVWFKF